MDIKTAYLIVVHAPHKDWIETYLDKEQCEERFRDILEIIGEKYGQRDRRGASLQHCLEFGYYDISLGYFAQMYESDIGKKDDIEWLDPSKLIRGST